MDFDCFIYFADGKIVQSMGHALWNFSKSSHVLFVGRIVAGEIPVFWLISLTETSFSYAQNVMYVRSSALKGRAKTLHGKWNSQTLTIGYLNQARHTSWFSCHQLFCCHLFSMNYLLFCEMYEIHKEQIYMPASNAQNRLFQSKKKKKKTTWENVLINVHYLTQQNSFQINGFAQRKPPSPVQSCLLQMLRNPAFFWRPNNTASRGRGGREESVGYEV